ncbi:Cell division cycle and apoptosis regulator protein 1 [Acipenser ruthenus]|uniref:Cell division cycle and apoptosis regulator protein 1 n=1 Tax=Acipenser ruthenus TaxID=7906 RepID=A0A444UN72_ACIRT|nr:Cell division cycle and apoptosis regulator protein 1 [Acipenser ruthenus]
MAQFGGQKNPPWAAQFAASAVSQQGQSLDMNSLHSLGVQQPSLLGASPAMYSQQSAMAAASLNSQSAAANYQLSQQTAALQQQAAAAAAAALQQQTAQITVSYPTPRSSQQQTQPQKQRVFTGVVTKLHDTFGFVDEDVFFQISAVKGKTPQVGDRVLVEAAYNPNMPFKWNAQRIQTLPHMSPQMASIISGNQPQGPPLLKANPAMMQSLPPPSFSLQAQAPPPCLLQAQLSAASLAPLLQNPPQPLLPQPPQKGGLLQPPVRMMPQPQPARRLDPVPRFPVRNDRVDLMVNRKDDRSRERERERRRSRERSPQRKRSRDMSPRRERSPRRTRRVVPRYTVQFSKFSLDCFNCDMMELRRRYQNLYIPSDFFDAEFTWVDAFPASRPFQFGNYCNFHIMHREVDSLVKNTSILDPPDANHLYSAKVMLLANPSLEELYHKSCALADDPQELREAFQHPARLIKFLVGMKGKDEAMAIGGHWSPSLDGANPEKDHSVLIKTAIRSCKALTGIDLSLCTQWYRFAEIRYHRPEETHKGRTVPAHVETVVLFLPDVWHCLPTRSEWETLSRGYKQQLYEKLQAERKEADGEQALNANPFFLFPLLTGTGNTGTKMHTHTLHSKTIYIGRNTHLLYKHLPSSKIPKFCLLSVTFTLVMEEEEKDEGESKEISTPTHWSKLDPKSMKVNDLRKELESRSLSSKGLKSQLIARLTKQLKVEEQTDEIKEPEKPVKVEEEEEEQLKVEEDKEEEERKRQEEAERQRRERRYILPDEPTIIVHPNWTAKNGKFDCSIMSLSVLLDYRLEDNKEHSFEVSLFAELFNEMLQRDFGYRIYKALAAIPLKDEKKEKKEKAKKEADKKDCDKKEAAKKEEAIKEVKEEKEEDNEEPAAKKIKIPDEKEEKKEKEKEEKREESKEDEENEEESSNTNPDEYDPMEAEEAEDDDEEEKEEEMSDKDKKDEKKEDRKSKERSSKDKEKEKKQMTTYNKDLLMAFVYFDQSHCGYLLEKDLEEIMYTLGLHLSRAQVKKLLNKTAVRESCFYRKLTDRAKDEAIPEIPEAPQELLLGNKALLPCHNVKQEQNESQEVGSLIVYNGAMVDVGSLIQKLEKSEKDRERIEQKLQSQEAKIEEDANSILQLETANKSFSTELEDVKNCLGQTEENLKDSEEKRSCFEEHLHKTATSLSIVLNELESVLKKGNPKPEENDQKSKENGSDE